MTESGRMATRRPLWARIGWPYMGCLRVRVGVRLDCQFLSTHWLVYRADVGIGASGCCGWKWFGRRAFVAAVWSSDGFCLAVSNHDDYLTSIGSGYHNIHIMSAAQTGMQPTAPRAGQRVAPA